MERIVFLIAMFLLVPGISVVFAPADAGNFCRSSSVNVQEVSFDKLEAFFKEYFN